MAGACGNTQPSDQRRLNTAMVGAHDTLSDADSETVSAIGLELVALAGPLEAFLDDREPREQLLTDMRHAVDRIRARVAGASEPAVRATFEPYVTAWERILEALQAGDQRGYDAALARIAELDQRRVARVADAFGVDTARELLESEHNDSGGGDSNR